MGSVDEQVTGNVRMPAKTVPKTFRRQAMAVLTDSQFLLPLGVLLLGIVLLWNLR
jgi:hypothetical protein